MSLFRKCAALTLVVCLALVTTRFLAAEDEAAKPQTFDLPGGGSLVIEARRIGKDTLEISQELKLTNEAGTVECKVCCSSEKEDGSKVVACRTCSGPCTGKGRCEKGKPKPCQQ